MTLDEARENLRTLQHEVVVASLSHHPSMGEAAREGSYYPEGASSSSCAPKGGSDAGVVPSGTPQGSGVCSTSGRVLLSHLHQHGQTAPWAAADEVCEGERRVRTGGGG